MKADRRLWFTRDKDTVVEDGALTAATLFAAPGDSISDDDVERLRLVVTDGRVCQAPVEAPPVVEEIKEQPKPEDKQIAKPATKRVTKKATKKKKATNRRSKG